MKATHKKKSGPPPEVIVIAPRLAGRRSMLQAAHARTVKSMQALDEIVKDPTHYPVLVPSGARGKWSIQDVEVSGFHASMRNMKLALDGFPEMAVTPGTYKTLTFLNSRGDSEVMMSNTQFEYRTNVGFVQNARGHVLISGLGLGMLLRPLAAKPEVLSITVIEKDPDVIALVAPHYADIDKLSILNYDIFRYKCSRMYDWGMHDIWPTTCPENLNQMHALRHRFRADIRNQVCWAEDICRRMGEQIRELRQLKKATHGTKRSYS